MARTQPGRIERSRTSARWLARGRAGGRKLAALHARTGCGALGLIGRRPLAVGCGRFGLEEPCISVLLNDTRVQKIFGVIFLSKIVIWPPREYETDVVYRRHGALRSRLTT